MNRTGFALGRLNPIVYYENADGQIILPPTTADARYFYSQAKDAQGQTYREKGFEFREADTLAAVDELQRRLTEAELRRLGQEADRDDRLTAMAWKQRGSDLRARMISANTSPYERDFIDAYLQLREEKRAKHRQRFMETTMYLEAREMDSGHHATDRIKG